MGLGTFAAALGNLIHLEGGAAGIPGSVKLKNQTAVTSLSGQVEPCEIAAFGHLGSFTFSTEQNPDP